MADMQRVWLLPGGTVLSAALGAALTLLGWRITQLAGEDELAGAAREISAMSALILLPDVRGGLPDPRAALVGRPRPFTVAVGMRGELSVLADIVERRVAAAVLDADQPFTNLVAGLDRLLRLPTAVVDDATRLVAGLREREQEARRFSALTRREQQVLCALLVGCSATEIAAADQVSLPTVRSHIRAVLTKLGVSSQLAAVALAHRSCRESALLAHMREVHHF
ncbi:LuxR C-terminal-related transcriptional regulator [Streptomyces sp. BE20]|uniref:helix-turn-helix transcriptional regulator n=1 Tax=Streptomyces sp. BE20 TaxID=3002525 RepID=UPI002E7906F3|nr:LuxR C-terminal-related transcriptional regulator [Streptomyces sp. BE20]MEE1821635.1 LuxR C-terminal-related transcriptional regulator [Streptomyces sp. BE20]